MLASLLCTQFVCVLSTNLYCQLISKLIDQHKEFFKENG